VSGLLRMSRLHPEMVDTRVAQVVNHLKEVKFLEGTLFEKRALEQGIEPYSLLIGILVGWATAVIIGLFTIELWLPRAISRITGKALTEVTTAVREVMV